MIQSKSNVVQFSYAHHFLFCHFTTNEGEHSSGALAETAAALG